MSDDLDTGNVDFDLCGLPSEIVGVMSLDTLLDKESNDTPVNPSDG